MYSYSNYYAVFNCWLVYHHTLLTFLHVLSPYCFLLLFSCTKSLLLFIIVFMYKVLVVVYYCFHVQSPCCCLSLFSCTKSLLLFIIVFMYKVLVVVYYCFHVQSPFCCVLLFLTGAINSILLYPCPAESFLLFLSLLSARFFTFLAKSWCLFL